MVIACQIIIIKKKRQKQENKRIKTKKAGHK